MAGCMSPSVEAQHLSEGSYENHTTGFPVRPLRERTSRNAYHDAPPFLWRQLGTTSHHRGTDDDAPIAMLPWREFVHHGHRQCRAAGARDHVWL